jgi:hypothetical protein
MGTKYVCVKHVTGLTVNAVYTDIYLREGGEAAYVINDEGLLQRVNTQYLKEWYEPENMHRDRLHQ